MSKLIIMLLATETQAGSVEVQPARDTQLNATNCRWDGNELPSRFTSFADNSQLCNALKNLIKIVPPKVGSVSVEDRKSLKTVKRICPIHAEPVQNQYKSMERAKQFYNSPLTYLLDLFYKIIKNKMVKWKK